MSWRHLVLAFTLACSSPAKHPTLVIAETRTYFGQTARGEARVFQTPSSHARLAGARAWLAIAEAVGSTAAGRYQAAVRGAIELGPDYAGKGVRDETHVKEMGAKYEFDAGHEESAADVMVRVLRSRIAMYRHRYTTEVE
jgi:hypothetical protein